MKAVRVIAIGIASLALLLILGAVIGLSIGRPFLYRTLVAYVEGRVSAHGDLSLKIGSIGGSPFSGTTLRDVRIEARVPGLPSVPLFEADTVSIGYSPRRLVRGRRVSWMRVVGPHLHADGLRARVKAPAALPAKGWFEGPAAALLGWGIDSVSIVQGEVTGLEGWRLEQIAIESGVEIVDGAVQLDVRRARLRADSLDVVVAGAVGIRPDSVSLQDGSARFGASRALFRGSVRFAPSLSLDLSVALDTLRLADLGPLGIRASLDGSASGRVVVRGDPSDLLVEGELGATYGPYAGSVDRIRLRVHPDELLVDTLRVRSGEAELAGSARLPRRGARTHRGAFDFRGIDLHKLAGDSARVPETDLNGRVSWVGGGWLPSELDGELELDLGPGRVGETPFDRASATGRISGGVLEARRVAVSMFGGSIVGSGTVTIGGELDLAASAEFDDLSRVASRLKLSGASGRGRFDGRIVRAAGRLTLDGTLVGERWTTSGFRFDAVEATGRLVSDAGATTVVASGRIGAIDAYGKRLGNLNAAVRYEAGHFFLENFEGRIGDTDFEARGEWGRDDEGDRFLITSGAFTRNGKRTEFPNEIEVRREETRFSLLPIAVAFRGGRVIARAEIDAGGPIEAEVRWEGVRLSALPIPAPLDARLFDQTAGSLTLSGTAKSPVVHVTLDGHKDAPDSTSFASLTARVDYATPGPLRASVHLADREGLDRLTIDGVLADSVSVAALTAPGSLSEKLRSLLHPDVMVRANELPLEWVRPLAKELASFGGPVTAAWRFHGDLGDLSASGPFSTHGITYLGARVAGLSGTMRLEKGRLDFDVEFEDDWGASKLAVSLPARLDATRPSLTFDKEAPISIAARIERGDLGVLPLIVKQVREASGEFSLSLDGSGTLAAPDFTGTMHASGGALILRNLAELYEDVSGDLTLDGSLFTFRGITARVGEKGRVEANGSLRLVNLKADDFDFVLKAHDFDLESIPETGATLDADLVVRTQTTDLWTRVLHITGTIDLKGGAVEQDFEPAVPGAPPPVIFRHTDKPDFTCEITVRAPGDLWISNRDMEIELRGEGTLFRSTRGLGFIGSLDAVRGTYFLYRSWIANSLRIEDGQITWGDPDNAMNMRIAATASTEVGNEKITVTCDGPLDSLQVRASSESGRPESEIIQMLGLSTASGVSQAGSRDLLQSWVGVGAGLLAHELLNGAVQASIVTEGGRPSIQVGKYLRSNIYFDYSQSIEGWPGSKPPEGAPNAETLALPDRQFRVNYNVTRDVFLETLTGSRRDGSRFLNLDLKLRVGY